MPKYGFIYVWDDEGHIKPWTFSKKHYGTLLDVVTDCNLHSFSQLKCFKINPYYYQVLDDESLFKEIHRKPTSPMKFGFGVLIKEKLGISGKLYDSIKEAIDESKECDPPKDAFTFYYKLLEKKKVLDELIPHRML